MQHAFRRSLLGTGVAALTCAWTGASPASTLEGELYGNARYAYSHYDDQGDSPRSNRFDSTNSNAGVQVTVSQSAYSATLVYERALDDDDSNPDLVRQSYVRVATPYGTGIYGKAPTAYKLTGQVLDPFYNTALGTINGAAFGDASAVVRGPGYGLSALTSDAPGNGFIGNQLAYMSPSISGIRVNAAFFINENDAPQDDHDYGVGAEWSDEVFGGTAVAGAQYLDIRSSANFSAIGVPGTGAVKAARIYTALQRDDWGVSASWEPLDLKSGEDRDYVHAAGWYRVLERTRVALAYGNTNGTPFEGDSVSLGVFHEVFDALEVYAAARVTDRDAAPDQSSNLAVGASYRFSLHGEQQM